MIKKILLSTIIALNQFSVCAEIKTIKVKIGGMVCTACVTTMKQLLKKVPSLQAVKNIDLKESFVLLALTDNNNLTVDALINSLKNLVSKSTYKFEEIMEITARGVIEKKEPGYFFHIAGSNDTLSIVITPDTEKKFADLSASQQELVSTLQLKSNEKGSLEIVKMDPLP